MKYLVILFLFLNSLLYSQIPQISGRVTDASDNTPLSQANVYIEGKTEGTPTDQKGEFFLKGDFTKKDIIVVSYLGYETVRIRISDYIAGKLKLIKLESKVLTSQTVLVKGSIGREGITPATFSKISRKDIEDNYTTQDLPEYLSYLPSTTFYSENGNGIGYNFLSLRGFDQRRISVSVNGIPQNDPEDHNVYWLDMPDLLESTEMIQVQRGAGSGVIGYPSIGGSINIITSPFSAEQKLNFSASAGSYNTRKYSAVFASGLIADKYSVYVKLSKILSSGYRNNSWVDFNSYHFSTARYDQKLTTQINIFGGPVADGLAYFGLPKTFIKDKDLRRINFLSPDEIENFSQPHFELLNEFKLNDRVTLNSALFLVIGKGFFDYDGSWAPYSYFRLTPQNGYDISGDPDTLYLANTLIRAQVENNQWGWIPRINIQHSKGELMFGGEFRVHRSVHWGSINFAGGVPAGVSKNYRYYYYEGAKDIFNIFAHTTYIFTPKLNALAEIQLAYHKYELLNEKYLNNEFSVDGLFLNPRIGLNYKFTPKFNAYLAFARVSREPRLKNYYDAAESSGDAKPQFKILESNRYNFDAPLVKPETMNDIELGAMYSKENLSLSINLFYMMFNDEIVKKGQVDKFGQPITGNIDRTVHSGLEFICNLKFAELFEILFNGSYSRNYISRGETFIEYKDPKTGKINVAALNLADNRISGFPEITFNGILKFQYEGLHMQFSAKYVGDFFSDNYDDKLTQYISSYPGITDYNDNKVDAYFVSNFMGSYEFNPELFLTNVKIFFQVNNIFNNLYASYAIGGEFFPAAERNFLTGIKIGL